MIAKTVVCTIVLVAVLAACVAPANGMITQNNQNNASAQASARWLFGETPGAYQYVALTAMWYTALMTSVHPYALWVAYNDFDFLNTGGEYWSATASYRQLVAAWGWGVAVIETYWSASHFDNLLHEGAAPYFFYAYQQWTFAAYVLLAYAFSDVPDVNDEVSYGVGAGVSYEAQVSDDVTVTPALSVQQYDSGQDGWEDSLAVMAGVHVLWRVSDTWSVGGAVNLVTETQDIADDSWWNVGIKGAHEFSDTITGFASIGVTEGADDYDSTTFLVGVKLSF